MYRIFANPAETSISSYVEIIFQFALGIGIFLAVAAIVFGGIEYMTSYGNPEKITHAKEIIFAALAGLIVILISIMLLGILDPRLINLTDPEAVELDTNQGTNSDAVQDTCTYLKATQGYECIPKEECDGESQYTNDCVGDNICCKKASVTNNWACVWKCNAEKYPKYCGGLSVTTIAKCVYNNSDCNLLAINYQWTKIKSVSCGDETCKSTAGVGAECE